VAEWPCCHDPLRSSPTLHRFRPHLFPCRTSMPFSPLSLQSPCLASTGNSGLPSFGGRGGGQHGGQASKRGGGGGTPNFPKPRGKLRVPRSPDGSREFCAQDAEISGKFGVPPTLFPDGIGAGKFGIPPTLFPNGIGASAGKFGVPSMLLPSGIGANGGKKFGVPSTPFPNGIGASAGKSEVPSTPFPNGIGASVGKFGVPMSVQTESAPGLRDPPVYMSGRNSWQA